jgi:hypothetical protein
MRMSVAAWLLGSQAHDGVSWWTLGSGEGIRCAEETVQGRGPPFRHPHPPIGYVPGCSRAHSQGVDLAGLQENLHEVIEMLLEDGEPALESEFVDVTTIQVA